MRLTIGEYAAREGKSEKTIRRHIKDGKIPNAVKGDNGKWYITLGTPKAAGADQAAAVEGVTGAELLTHEELKKQKTAAEVKKLNQQIEQNKLMQFKEWTELFLDQLAESFAPFNQLVMKLELNEEQAEEFNETLEECLANLQTKSEGIFKLRPTVAPPNGLKRA